LFKLRQTIIWTVAVPIMMLATSGCATKKYVSKQVTQVNTRVSKLETQTNDRIAYLNNKEQSDISQVNERIATTDQRVTEVAAAAQQTQGSAARAQQGVDANQSAIASNSTKIDTLADGVANALNYQQVEKGDVTFGFNKATLTPDAKIVLDAIALKVQTLPRAVVELAGFTDKVGSANYNLALSRRRAEAVQRYLVMQKVPLRCIHIVGLGEEAPPAGLEGDIAAMDPNASTTELNRAARRVHIRVFGAGDITQGSASRVQQ
jgi:outer membrane protein OmpA-like peptidoglycan-associated protein